MPEVHALPSADPDDPDPDDPARDPAADPAAAPGPSEPGGTALALAVALLAVVALGPSAVRADQPWSAALVAPFAAATGWLLGRMSGRRAFLWAAAPALILYGASGGDLVPVALVTGAVFARWRGRPALGGALLGIAAATVVYPAFLLLPLVVERIVARDVRGAVRTGGAGVAAWLAVGLPLLIIDRAGRVAAPPLRIDRTPEDPATSVWFWLDLGGAGLDRHTVDLLSTGLVLLAWAVALGLGLRRAADPGGFPWVAVAAAMIAGFLAFAKARSPQDVMWILPFFALVRLRPGWWAALAVGDLALAVGLAHWQEIVDQDGGFGLGEQLAAMGDWGRTVFYALLVVVLPLTPTVFDDRRAAVAP